MITKEVFDGWSYKNVVSVLTGKYRYHGSFDSCTEGYLVLRKCRVKNTLETISEGYMDECLISLERIESIYYKLRAR